MKASGKGGVRGGQQTLESERPGVSSSHTCPRGPGRASELLRVFSKMGVTVPTQGSGEEYMK